MNTIIEAIRRSALGPPEKKDPDTIVRRYRFSDDFQGFSGHFPGYPILPAVVQLIAALYLIEEHKGHPLQLNSVQNAKFLQEIRPGSEILIQCIDCPVRGLPGSKIQIYLEDKIAASFLMTFSE